MARTDYGDFLPPDENCIPKVNLAKSEFRERKISKKWLPHESAEETKEDFHYLFRSSFP
jgi:hypothetical protein